MGQYPSAHWRRASVAQGDEADFAHRSETETNRTRRVSLQHTVGGEIPTVDAATRGGRDRQRGGTIYPK